MLGQKIWIYRGGKLVVEAYRCSYTDASTVGNWEDALRTLKHEASGPDGSVLFALERRIATVLLTFGFAKEITRERLMLVHNKTPQHEFLGTGAISVFEGDIYVDCIEYPGKPSQAPGEEDEKEFLIRHLVASICKRL